MMAKILCLGCRKPIPAGSSRCPECARRLRRRIEADPRRRARKRRLYDVAHVQERAAWVPIVNQGEIACWRCGQLLQERDELGNVIFDLGHRGDRPRAPEHPVCNRGAR